MQDNPFQHEWVNQTTLHPLGIIALVVLGASLLLVQRRWALVPIMMIACFIAPAQRIVVAGLDFNLLRLMVLCGAVRVLLRGEARGFRFHSIDYVLLAWAVVSACAYVLQRWTAGAMIYQAGQLFDAIGIYFLLRMLVRDWEDLRRLLLATSVIAVPVVVFFMIEKATGRNSFAMFGGVPSMTRIRQGEIRAQGPYPHPIIAGCFWASLLPLLVAQWWDRKRAVRCLGLVGGSCALVIIFCTASSTSVAAAGAALFAGLLFPLRFHLRYLRWGVVGLLIGLHLIMKAPVWHLIARVDLVGGSTGWHRYRLIDEFIKRVDEWWLYGTNSTAHWGRQLFDVTNQYVAEGVTGGIVALALFIALIAVAFHSAGRLWRGLEASNGPLWWGWALGASLFVHVMSYIAVTYFGQIIVIWYLCLASIASLSQAEADPVQTHDAALDEWTPPMLETQESTRSWPSLTPHT